MIVYVVRHGETEWNRRGIVQGSKNSPLSSTGRRQAEHVANYLQSGKIKQIYASSLGRAQETAEAIASKTGARTTAVPEFAEMCFGKFEGKAKVENEHEHADFFMQHKQSAAHKLLVPYPDGESYHDVYLRVRQPLLNIMAQAESCIIVGHEGVNRMLRGIILEQELEHMINSRQKNNEIVVIDVAKAEEQVIAV